MIYYPTTMDTEQIRKINEHIKKSEQLEEKNKNKKKSISKNEKDNEVENIKNLL